MRKHAMGRPSSSHVNDRGRAFSRSDIRRNAGRNRDLDRCPGRIGQQVAMTRPVFGNNILNAVHDERQSARFARPPRGNPCLDAAANP